MARSRVAFPLTLALSALTLLSGACHRNPPPVPVPVAPPSTSAPPVSQPSVTAPPSRPITPPEPVREPPQVPMEPLPPADELTTKDLDGINRAQPLKPALFALDSEAIDTVAQQVLADDAQVLKKYPSWVITIEGHCDERGTAEYNLALGERRALAAKNYLMSLGIAADRLKTVSYGKEFPFDPGLDEGASSKNRRAHFQVTAK